MQLNTCTNKSNRLPNVLKNLSINNQSITIIGNHCEEKSIKFLGVHLDENLTWQAHINYISKKISQSLFAIHRVKHILPTSSLKSLYYALIHSHLSYAIQVWGNSNFLYKLITRQKRALRAISKKPYLSHTEPLFKHNKILKLEDLYCLQVTIFMYDLHTNVLPSSFNSMKKERSNYSIVTRQTNSLYMPTDRARTDYSSKLPKHQFPKLWNENDDIVKKAKSRTIAKKSITNNILKNYKVNVTCRNANCRYCN